MKKIYLSTPKLNELGYRKKLLADKETMTYNEAYGGAIDFNESKWETWYAKWIGNNDDNFFYAYIYDKETNVLVGEVGYRKDEETSGVLLNIIIEANNRGKGYGVPGLVALIETAFKNGFKEVRDLIANTSISSHKLFEKVGFKCVGEVDNSKDYRMSLEDYINKYGELN